jgi:flotillin
MESFAVAGGIVVFILGFIFSAFMVYATRYKKVGPNEVLVISGRKHRRLLPSGESETVGYRICKGGGAFIWPIIEKYDILSLELLTLDVKTPEVYTAQGVPVVVDGVAQVKVRGDDVAIGTAAEQFLSKGDKEILNIGTMTLEGHLRAILGTLSVEELYKDREMFSQRVQEMAAHDMANMGLQIVSFTLKDIRDEHGYLEAIGKPRTAQVKRDAIVAQAEADRDAAIKAAEARQAGETARFRTESEIALASRDYEMRRAQYQASVNEERAKAEAAYEIMKFRKGQEVKKEEVQIELIEKQQQALVEEQEILRRERELEATVRKPADAEKYRVQAVAEAEKLKLELEASGRATAEREMGTARADVTTAAGNAEADAIRARGLAEAEVVKETGLAQAKAMAEKAESWKQYNDAAIAQMMVDVLPKLAEAIAAPLAKTDRITIVGGGGDGGTGLSGITGDVARMMAQIPPVAESLTGVKISDVVARMTGAKPDDNPAQE